MHTGYQINFGYTRYFAVVLKALTAAMIDSKMGAAAMLSKDDCRTSNCRNYLD
jgi:hypothetical protein